REARGAGGRPPRCGLYAAGRHPIRSRKRSVALDMADIVDRKTRSRMMSGIRGADTKPELAVRRYLHAKGLRFTLHAAHLPGRPDIVLPKYRSAVFVHGCFWHRHAGCRFAYGPRSRQAFWREKFRGNVERDKRDRVRLEAKGWRVHIIWECAC